MKGNGLFSRALLPSHEFHPVVPFQRNPGKKKDPRKLNTSSECNAWDAGDWSTTTEHASRRARSGS